MDYELKASRLRHDPQAGTSGVLVWIGRSLLFLSAVSLVTMPLTQHLWTWDHFLHGGQDFESSALMLLTFLCLVLVLSKHCKRCMDSLFRQWCLRAFDARGRVSRGIWQRQAFSILRASPLTGPAAGVYSIPLQI